MLCCCPGRNLWNRLDLLVAVLCLVTLVVGWAQASLLRSLMVFRIEKMLRVLKMARWAVGSGQWACSSTQHYQNTCMFRVYQYQQQHAFGARARRVADQRIFNVLA